MEENLNEALQQAQGKKNKSDDILYINLEPCCHHGSTPPCTDAIVASGIKHVVIGMVDPDARVAGKGIAILRRAGIEVIGPVLRAECERLNRGYISLRTKGRPYITLKRAQTIDGRVAGDNGTRLCITSEEQNVWSHTFLRSTHDAILVGVQTVLSDDPLLTIRMPADRSLGEGSNKKFDQSNPQPVAVILDPDLRIPLEARVLRKGTVVVIKETKGTKGTKEALLKKKGVTVIKVPMIDGHFDWEALWKSLSTLHSPLSTLLVEGGPKTWEAFRKAGIVDEEVILIGNTCD